MKLSMSMAQERLVLAFHNDKIFEFERASTLTASRFGGPMPGQVTGVAHGPKPLHLVADLASAHIPALNWYGLPLVYGMHYNCGELVYRVHSSHSIEVLKLTPPQSLDDFPYPHFPPLLPFIPLRLADIPRRQSYAEFADQFPSMPERPRADLIVAVPPLATIGVSLWGAGDAEDATIIFECDLKDRIVNAFNVAS